MENLDTRFGGPNLAPPEEGFGLWRHTNADRMRTEGWAGLFWARRAEGGDYELRTLARQREAYSYPAGLCPREPLEGLYERVGP